MGFDPRKGGGVVTKWASPVLGRVIAVQSLYLNWG